MTRRLGTVLVVATVLSGAVGCSGDGADVADWEGVEVVEGGACGDVTFWAVNEDRDVVVRVIVPALARSMEEPTEVSFTLPNRTFMVEAIHGTELPNHCEDGKAYLSGVRYSSAREGSGTMQLGPRTAADSPACGTTGSIHIDGLVTDDGTAFAPFSIAVENVGCYEPAEEAGALGTVARR